MSALRMAYGEDMKAPFRLDSLNETAPPPGCDGVWQRYVITQGGNTIVGVRCGARSEVNSALDEMVTRLNLRFAKQTRAWR